MNRLIAIGDVHGCAKALSALLSAIAPTPDDTLIPLGDYVDRGSDSRGVIAQMIELRSQCRLIPLMGNHEIMMLAALRGTLDPMAWQRFGGADTLASYGGQLSEIAPEHHEFLASCLRFYESEAHIFMHANYLAHFPLEEQPEQFLFWTHISTVLPPPHQSGKKAIVGHTPQIGGEILDLGHLVCIDTCCFAGGWLTALDVNTGQVWQADQWGRMREV